MYKDKDKQREANKLQMQRARAAKGNTKQLVGQSNTSYPRVTDQDFTKLIAGAGPNHVRASKPGDADYEPMCETTKAFVEGRSKVEPKRGLDIKCFEDLPPDVQQTIRTISDSNEEFQRRTVIAIHYQHTFPGRY